MDKLRFAIVGCGKMGSRRINVLKNHPEAKIVALVDTNEEKVKILSTELGCEYYVDYKEAFKRTDIDCVIVATPNKFHAPITIAGLESGKHVWCEKPLARNPVEARSMVDAAIRTKNFLKTGSNMRYFPNFVKAKELVDGLGIGSLLFLRGWIGNNGQQLEGWFKDIELTGGGTYLDNGCHMLDLVRWFLGDAENCIGHAWSKHWSSMINSEDNAFGVYKFANGGSAFVHSSWTDWNGYAYIEIYGTTGFIIVDSRGQNNKTIFGDNKGVIHEFDFGNLPVQSYKLEVDDYIKAIKEGRQPVATGYDGLRAVQMACAVYESSKNDGKSVKIDSL